MASASEFDVVVLGAGAAGMICAATAAQSVRKVALLDHAQKLAEKIRISGGGRCNFTNRDVTYENFVSENPQFSRAALGAFSAQDFIALVDSHRIAWHEKHRGQLFCDDSSEQIIRMLKRMCDQGRVSWRMPCSVESVQHVADRFELRTTQGLIKCRELVVATGGTALPQVGSTDFGLRLARQFGLRVVAPRPALVPLQFDHEAWQSYASLAGVALQARVGVQGVGQTFDEDILFTHRGLSGPGILQISTYWQPGRAIDINLVSDLPLGDLLLARKSGTRQQMGTVLSEYLPKRVAERWLGERSGLKIAQWSDRAIAQLTQDLAHWQLIPSGTAGFRKAEVMSGGVDTAELDQQTLMTKKIAGLYFIGEVVDMTGWLGGYNFQWAWSSGVACGRALCNAA